MSTPAVFSADYYNFEYKKGLKVCRLVFEVPYEHAGLVRDVLGDPPLGGAQVRVAIARLKDAPSGATEAAPERGDKGRAVSGSGEPNGEASPRAVETSDRPQRHFNDLSRSQQAALKCQDEEFIGWLCVHNPEAARVHIHTLGAPTEKANAALKRILGITSRKELDIEGHKALAFDRLLTDFSVRGIVR